jgi:hypothetical protein
MTYEFEKINDDAWLPVRQSDDFHLQFAKFMPTAFEIRVRGSAQSPSRSRMSNY